MFVKSSCNGASCSGVNPHQSQFHTRLERLNKQNPRTYREGLSVLIRKAGFLGQLWRLQRSRPKNFQLGVFPQSDPRPYLAWSLLMLLKLQILLATLRSSRDRDDYDMPEHQTRRATNGNRCQHSTDNHSSKSFDKTSLFGLYGLKIQSHDPSLNQVPSENKAPSRADCKKNTGLVSSGYSDKKRSRPSGPAIVLLNTGATHSVISTKVLPHCLTMTPVPLDHSVMNSSPFGDVEDSTFETYSKEQSQLKAPYRMAPY
ncbi:hypothetical protein Tco_0954547 [Tanacetum coccineum]|uniref:Uncharacterized protein n=1 Tax=Tanacetum coccineum TaxID=301880 RepID=A0ABQ5E4P6_9ASTR